MYKPFSVILFSVFACSCGASTSDLNPMPKTAYPTADTPAVQQKDTIIPKNRFADFRKKYSTCIPIMNGWFIVCDSFDVRTYTHMIQELVPTKTKNADTAFSLLAYIDKEFEGYSINTKKWGVVDSFGNIIIPFVCDAVREFEAGKGIFSIYKGSRSLNTGLPRYNYSGYYYYFDKQGISKAAGKLFHITTIFVGDFHNARFVMEKGPAFYLPYTYHKPNEQARGHLSREYIRPQDNR